MSDSPPPDVAANAAVGGVAALTPEAIAAVLEDFRSWLTSAVTTAPPPPAGPAVDLSTLVGQFTALRHEVNLQTRAVRAQQEQNAETLRHLAEALDTMIQAPAPAPPPLDAAAEDRVRPLLKSLVDLYDSVALAGRELERAGDSVQAILQPIEEIEVSVAGRADFRDTSLPQPPWWLRWLGARRRDTWASFQAWAKERTASWRQERQVLRDKLASAYKSVSRTGKALAATAEGFAMTLQRVERAMAQHGLEPIPAVGRPFDPDRMEALEVVLASGRPSGEVVQEVRRGYLWQGRVFRYAQVRVAKNSA